MSSKKQIIVVAAGVLQRGNPPETLAVRRVEGKYRGYWEFPGGKQEHNETLKDCLTRELREELCVDAHIGQYIGCSEYSTPMVRIVLHAFLITDWSGDIVLNVHDDLQWLSCDRLHTVDWSPADIPLLKKVNQLSLDDSG